MPVRSARERSGSGRDRDAAVVAEGVSKLYPSSRVTIFPPIVSVFDRELNPFKRKRSSEDAERSSEDGERSSADRDARTAADSPMPRSAAPAGQLDYDLDDEMDDEEDEDDLGPEEGGTRRTPWDPGDMFWALRDISFLVRSGGALGVLGGPASGKSTLLRILGGQAFPTEGRVLVRDRVSAVSQELAKGIGLSGAGTFDADLVLGSRLLGVDPHHVKRHRDEIEELCQPLKDAEGEPAPGAMLRLAIASAVILPASVILLDEHPRVDDAFMAQIIERARERVRAGSTLVLASRSPDLAAQVCDEAIVLSGGSIARRGSVNEVSGAVGAMQGDGGKARGARSGGGRTPAATASTEPLWQEEDIDVPPVIAPFNASAALISAAVKTTAGGRSKRFDAADELSVEIRFETALPNVELHGGIRFAPRNRETGIRLEPPAPYRLVDPGTYVLAARVVPGTLPTGDYAVRADAIVSNGAEGKASVIARDIGSIRIAGDELDVVEPVEEPVAHWDGSSSWLVEAEWSIVGRA